MKRVSIIAMLTIGIPYSVFGYGYTITDSAIRDKSYTVEQIYGYVTSIYNTALSQNPNSPVFIDDGLYKWMGPDLTQYQTSTLQNLFSLSDTGHGFVDFLEIDSDGNVSTKKYYALSLASNGRPGVYVNSHETVNSIGGQFINASLTAQHIAVIHNRGTIESIDGEFYCQTPTGNVIYNEGGSITSINGAFVNNSISQSVIGNSGEIDHLTGTFVNNYLGTGGAIRNNNTINSVYGVFIGNQSEGGAAISNTGTVNSITGDFVNNHTIERLNYQNELLSTYGGAIKNYGTINSITGDFVGNYVIGNEESGGGAIYNAERTISSYRSIGSITGNFVDNYAANGGAIFNGEGGYVTLTNNVNFINNKATVGGAIYNEASSSYQYNPSVSTITMNIDGDSAIRFVTSSDTIHNDSVVIANGTTVGTPGELYLQSVSGVGTFSLNNISATLAYGQSIAQSGFTIDSNSSLTAEASGITHIDTLTNDGNLHLGDGTFTNNVTGDGAIYIDGHVESNVNISQDLYICCIGCVGSSIANDFFNNRYNTDPLIIGTPFTLITDADDLTADSLTMDGGILGLTGGTLSDINIITPSDDLRRGAVYISGDVTSNVNLPTFVYVTGYDGTNLHISADNLSSAAVVRNYGTITLTGGTLNVNFADLNGNYIIDGDVTALVWGMGHVTINSGKSLTTNLNNLSSGFSITNNGTLWLSGDLDAFILPYFGDYGVINDVFGGAVGIDEYMYSNANRIDKPVANRGNLYLTGGILSNSVTGTGNIYITEDVTSNVDMALNTIINSNKTLTVAANNIHSDRLTNNGLLKFSGGTLNENISGFGNVQNIGDLYANGSYIDQSFTNNGTLNITGGTLSRDITSGTTIIANGATLEATHLNNLQMNGTWNVGSNTVNVANTTINGLVYLNIDTFAKDSSDYTGGKIIADNVTLGSGAGLQLVVGTGDIVESGDSTGELQPIQTSGSWTGDWTSMLRDNSMYSIIYNPVTHGIRLIKSSGYADIAGGNGGTDTDVAVATAWTNETSSSDQNVQDVIDALNYYAQYDIPAFLGLLRDLAPTGSLVVSGASRVVNSAIENMAFERLGTIGHDDEENHTGVWAQGLYNTFEQSENIKFKGNTFGFSFGADQRFGTDFVLGGGYAFNNTSLTAGRHEVSGTGHTFFAYGEYRDRSKDMESETQDKESSFFINGLLSYGIANYSEDTPNRIKSEYTTSVFGATINSGYGLTDDMDLYVGTRYLKITQDDYTDSAHQYVSVRDNDIITAKIGGRYMPKLEMFNPVLKLELTYDVKSDDGAVVVNTPHSGYQIVNEAINPFGVQFGAGLTTKLSAWELSLNYDMEWHSSFISHTGRINAKYMF